MDLKVVSILLVGILIGGSVGYLYLKPQIDNLTAEIGDHEERYEALSQQQEDLQQEQEDGHHPVYLVTAHQDLW